MTIKMTDLLEEIVSRIYEGRKKKGAETAVAVKKDVELKVRKDDGSPYGKIEKKTVSVTPDKGMSSTSSQAKDAKTAGGKKETAPETKPKKKAPRSGYDKTTSAERAKRAVTGEKETAAIDAAKEELKSWEERKKAHKKAELKSVRRAVSRDEYIARKSQEEKEKEQQKKKKKAERKEFFKKNAKKKGEQ